MAYAGILDAFSRLIKKRQLRLHHVGQPPHVKKTPGAASAKHKPFSATLPRPPPHSFLLNSWRSIHHSVIGDRNLILMGPPGSGKTTVGRLLGQKLGLPVIDVDNDVLEKDWNMSVSDKLQDVGNEEFVEEEGKALLRWSASGSVISLSGSNPMHPASMKHLQENGIVVYLDVHAKEIVERLEDMKVDRIVGQSSGASMGDLLRGRKQFYKQWHDFRVLCEGGDTVEAIAEKVLDALKRYENSGSEAFISTRSICPEKGDPNGSTKTFSEVVVDGLASDGGLFVPARGLPSFTTGEWRRLMGANYVERAQIILERCIPPADMPAVKLGYIVEKAYGKNFACSQIAPVRHLVGNQYLLELFHGPTASFKDLALQLMPQIFAYCIPSSCNSLVLAATSGDTGSAVLHGFSCLNENDKQRIAVVSLFPENGISPVQKMQIIGCQSANGLSVGVKSDFDFCQKTLKHMLTNPEYTGYLTAEYGTALSTANSINWARLLPQVVYHGSAYLDLVSQGFIEFGSPIDVCIPTGNFGNMLAASYAKLMGIPIRKLICASNQNNVLTEFIKTGHYDLRNRKLLPSISPAIDILKSSNLERYIHLISNGNGQIVNQLFSQLESEGHFQLPNDLLQKVQLEIVADWCSEEDCLAAIHSAYHSTGYVLDTHTAVAKAVADRLQDKTCPVLIASTAHYSKFAPAILKALRISAIKQDPLSQLHMLQSMNLLPPAHEALWDTLKRAEHEKHQVCAADASVLMNHVETILPNLFLKIR
ncbi:threonine synthase-like 1 [Ambystoma mexicanum]|uniref:threonine synthase-like 1 n=1 Tax=Ambystoma mexicanum TaxID=8296 RepID=UPI0037E88A7A